MLSGDQSVFGTLSPSKHPDYELFPSEGACFIAERIPFLEFFMNKGK
jgi:hypothetical protein